MHTPKKTPTGNSQLFSYLAVQKSLGLLQLRTVGIRLSIDALAVGRSATASTTACANTGRRKTAISHAHTHTNTYKNQNRKRTFPTYTHIRICNLSRGSESFLGFYGGGRRTHCTKPWLMYDDYSTSYIYIYIIRHFLLPCLRFCMRAEIQGPGRRGYAQGRHHSAARTGIRS